MSYSIFIERHDASGARIPITEIEWIDAVRSSDGVRLRTSDVSARNPKTGDLITIQGSGCDADFFDQTTGDWLPTFFWSSRGKIQFNATEEFEEPGSALRTTAVGLSAALNASLVGEEGELIADA
jgi:hypothetical protein